MVFFFIDSSVEPRKMEISLELQIYTDGVSPLFTNKWPMPCTPLTFEVRIKENIAGFA